MERYITDSIYENMNQFEHVETELAMSCLMNQISDSMDIKEFIPIEEELNRVYDLLEKEWFNLGFVEGIRFLLKCI